MRRASAWLLLGGLCACTLQPRDPFARAELALRRHDFAAAVAALDAVPVSHGRYPEARAAAVEVETKLRRCHELVAEALLLRAEWRDREALAKLQQAAELWPDMPGVQPLIAATTQRASLLQDQPAKNGAPRSVPTAPVTVATEAPVVVVSTTPPAPQTPVFVAEAVPIRDDSPTNRNAEPAEAPTASALGAVRAEPEVGESTTSNLPPAAPIGESAAMPNSAGLKSAAEPLEKPPENRAMTAPVAAERSSPSASTALTVANEREAALGLIEIEKRLAGGQHDVAVGELLELSQRFPADARVTTRLVRVLHQRALLRYGRGAVGEAVDDWQRILALDPENESARRMLAAAKTEKR